MELRQLKYFIKTKELLSFTDAAKALFISQSTLSQQIRQLEDELKMSLFDRVGKRIRLTEAGEIFSKYASQSLKNATDGLQFIHDLNTLERGSLSIGVTHGLNMFFTKAITKFTTNHPKIHLRIIVGTSEELIDRLNQFELDFILVFFNEEKRDPNFIYRPLFNSPVVCVTAKDSSISKRNLIKLVDLEDMNLAISTQIYDNTHFFYRFFKANQVLYAPTLEINDIPTVLKLVQTGKWHTIMVKKSVEDTDLLKIPIKGKGINRTAGIITLKGAYEKKSFKILFELLADLSK